MAVDVSRMFENQPGVTRPPGLTSPEPPGSYAQGFTPAQKQKLLADIGRTGWYATEPVPEFKQVPSNIPGALPETVPTGRWLLNLSDGKGNNQQAVLRREPEAQAGTFSWIPEEAPKELPKVDATTSTKKTLQDPWGGQWEYDTADPAGVPRQLLGGDVSQAATAQTNLASLQAVLREKNANATAGKGFVTNADAARDQADLASGVLKRDEFNQKVTESKRQYDLDVDTEKRLAATARAGIGLTQAQTTGVGVETAVNEQRLKQLVALEPHDLRKAELSNQVTTEELRQLAAMFPAKLQQMQDSGAYTKAQVDELRQRMRAPDVTNLGAGPYYATRTPEGGIEQRMSLGYQPKTQADVAARAGQIQAAAKAKEAEVMGKVGQGTYTAEDALAEFNGWYDQNVASQQAGLQAAQEEAAYQRAKDQAEAQRMAMTTAQGAGTQTINAYNAQVAGGLREGAPGFGDAMNKIVSQKGSMEGIDFNKAFSVPGGANLNQQANQAVQNSLQAISPTGAQGGNFNVGQIDIPGMFNRTNWMPGQTAAAQGGGPPQAAPAPGAGPTPGFTPRPGESAEASIARNMPLMPPQPGAMPPGANPFTPRPGETAEQAMARIAAMGMPDQGAWGTYRPG